MTSAAGADVTADLVKTERQWALSNPAGRAESLGVGQLALWNFAIDSAELKPEHLSLLSDHVLPLMFVDRSSIYWIVSGFASVTGSEAANERLARRRAEAVVRWLDRLGFGESIVADQPPGVFYPESGRSGEALARTRRVELVRHEPYPPQRVEPQAPVFKRPPIAEQQPPSTDTAEPRPIGSVLPILDLYIGELGRIRLSNAWIVGRLTLFETSVRLFPGQGGATTNVQGAIKPGQMDTQVSHAITDWLSARVTKTTSDDPTKNTVRAGLVFRTDVHHGGQRDDFEISHSWGNPAEPLYLAWTHSWMFPSTILGVEYTFLVTTRIKIQGSPGPATRALAMRLVANAATAATAIMESPITWAIVLVALFVVANVLGTERAKEEGIRRARVVASRDAFAARVAFEIVGQSAEPQVLSLMNEWRGFLDAVVRDDAVFAYESADRQIEALRANGVLGDARAAWTAAYGMSGGNTDLNFSSVKYRVFMALGSGWDGPTDFALGQLR